MLLFFSSRKLSKQAHKFRNRLTTLRVIDSDRRKYVLHPAQKPPPLRGYAHN